MPQTHNPRVLQVNCLEGRSRYANVFNLSHVERRKLEAVHKIDRKNLAFKMGIHQRHLQIWENGLRRIQKKLQDSLMRSKAYQTVADHRSFSKATDQQKALNMDYSFCAMWPDIRETLRKMDPSYIREQKAKILISKARRSCDDIIQRNLNFSLFSPSMNYAGTCEAQNEDPIDLEGGILQTCLSKDKLRGVVTKPIYVRTRLSQLESEREKRKNPLSIEHVSSTVTESEGIKLDVKMNLQPVQNMPGKIKTKKLTKRIPSDIVLPPIKRD